MGSWGTRAGSRCKCSLPGAHSERKQEEEPGDHPHAGNSRPRGLVGDKLRARARPEGGGISVRLAAPAPCMCGWRPQVEARSLYTDGGGDRPSWPGASSQQRPPREGRVDAPSAFSVEIGVITDLNLGMKEWPSSTPETSVTRFPASQEGRLLVLPSYKRHRKVGCPRETPWAAHQVDSWTRIWHNGLPSTIYHIRAKPGQ